MIAFQLPFRLSAAVIFITFRFLSAFRLADDIAAAEYYFHARAD